jgi:hypothetical protein
VTWQFGDRLVSSISIIDDSDESRSALALTVVDSDLAAIDQGGPLGGLDEAIARISDGADAAICDHQLRAKNYADFQGAELVAESTTRGFPAILCTRWIAPEIDIIRPLLPLIPVIRRPDELNEPSELQAALAACIAELSDDVPSARKGWRTQVLVERVDDEDPDVVYVSLPAWEIEEVVRLNRKYLPGDVADELVEGYRCHAMVNLGADSSDLLYFQTWDLPD